MYGFEAVSAGLPLKRGVCSNIRAIEEVLSRTQQRKSAAECRARQDSRFNAAESRACVREDFARLEAQRGCGILEGGLCLLALGV